MIRFSAFGHSNLKAEHKNTIEFTKDKNLSLTGDCILGVDSDFNLEEIKKFIAGKEKLKCRIEVDNISDEFEFIPNKKFNDKREIVFRLGEFASERTLGIRAGKSAKMIKREIVDKMKIPGKKMDIYITL